MDQTLPQIIAMGGGGFSQEPENPRLDRYILAQTGTPNPRVCFLPTATGDADRYIVNFYTAFMKLNCQPTHLALFQRTPDLRATLLSQDVIYVGGGNTKSMLGVWREWDLPNILREAWRAGVILAGVSAGAVCWFEQALSDSFAEELTAIQCLGFIKGSCCPHYNSEPERRPTYQRLVKEGQILPGLALDEGVAVHFIGQEIHRLVASIQGAQAYRVEVRDGEVMEDVLPIEFLEYPDAN